MDTFEQDIAKVTSIKAIPTMLEIVCRTTGMRFAAVARVTEDRWIACSVRDEIEFGLVPGGELKVETTLCHEIRQSGKAVIIDHVAEDARYCGHHTPEIYGLQSYISMPITLADGSFFGTLCAIDPAPHRLNTPEIINMFKMFADVIGFHLSTIDQMHLAQMTLRHEQQTAALREQFIAVLGHDLRNPLAGIGAGLAVLKKTPLNDRALSVIDMMRGSVTRMTGLIDDVMDFARARLGSGISLTRQTDDSMERLLRQVVSELQSRDQAHDILAAYQLTEPVFCDPRRIGQMVSNLLGNAVAYGRPGEPIQLTATTHDGWLTISVSNRGEPIPPAKLPTIFEPFTRGSDPANQQGLGLGLYISSEIARAHGGTLSVTSTSEETCFTFAMPLAG